MIKKGLRWFCIAVVSSDILFFFGVIGGIEQESISIPMAGIYFLLILMSIFLSLALSIISQNISGRDSHFEQKQDTHR